jgi:multiple sugar transport system substrate-binding protein
MNHGHYPPGPAGRFYFLPLYSSCVMKYSKQQKLAKDFIRFYMDRPQYDPYFELMDTFGIPGTRVYRDHPLWKKDPKTAVFPETLQYARTPGYAGPPDRRVTETLTKFIMVDMFAKSLQGMRPEDAVAWAAGEIRKIYGA